MSGWPDPEKPGVPLNPEQDGYHWIFNPDDDRPHPVIWVADLGAWAVGDAWTPRMVAEMGLHYLGPVLTPAEVDTLYAENARLREALGRAYEAVETCDETYPGSKYLNAELKAIRAALEPKGQKERRAKALAELAEMDADLLDLDPEVKP